MRISFPLSSALAFLLGTALAAPARAGDFNVPDAFATIQETLANAAVSPDADNFINLTESPVFTWAEGGLGSEPAAGTPYENDVAGMYPGRSAGKGCYTAMNF